MYNKSCTFRDGVMVAQMILDHLVWVRALVPEPNGPMVKWLRRCPLKAESGVQFPLGLPLKANPHSINRMRVFYNSSDCLRRVVFTIISANNKPSDAIRGFWRLFQKLHHYIDFITHGFLFRFLCLFFKFFSIWSVTYTY